jgi:hypothetical protein
VVAIGVCGNANEALKFPWRIIAAMGLLLAYAGFSQPIRHHICQKPLDPIKEVVMSMRGTLKPTAQSGSECLTASFPNHLSYYDPHAQRVKTAADLQNAMRDSAKLWSLFYESGLFVDFVIHHGMDNIQDRVVVRYQPGAIEELDIEKFLEARKQCPIPCCRRPPIPKSLHH